MGKSIAQFLPLTGQRPNASDRHYRRVHTPFARRTLREMPHVLSYHTDRARAELDLAGGWAQRPHAFRFVILRFEAGRSLEFPPEVRAQIAEDHRNFLRDFRGFVVDEHVVLDRLSGQTALVKYVVEYERADDADAAQAVARLEDALRAVAAHRPERFGLRQLLVNRVTAEAVAEPIDQPGQRTTDRVLPDTTKAAFVELYFDSRDRAEEWFAQPTVHDALFGGRWHLTRASRVSEECGFDRR
jgi:hypothetical protein